MRETRVRSPGGEDPLEKEMATHCNILARKIQWAEESGRLQFMALHGFAKSRTSLSNFTHFQCVYVNSSFSIYPPLPHGNHKFILLFLIVLFVILIVSICTVLCQFFIIYFWYMGSSPSLLRIGFLQLSYEGCYLVVVFGLLIVVASLTEELRLQARRLQQLRHIGSAFVI